MRKGACSTLKLVIVAMTLIVIAPIIVGSAEAGFLDRLFQTERVDKKTPKKSRVPAAVPTPTMAPIPTSRPDITRMFISDIRPMFTDDEPAAAPYGQAAYCLKYRDDCKSYDLTTEQQVLLPLREDLLDEVIRINREVNWLVAPTRDQKEYGQEERWEYPRNGRGDCEDYVLEKRRRLMQLGWPGWSLLIAEVQVGIIQAEHHAVLVIRFVEGDLIADNLYGDVLPWQYADMNFLRRQSATDPSKWVVVNDVRETEMFAAADHWLWQ